MLDAEKIETLYKREINVRGTRNFGSLKIEAPVNAAHVTAFGSCEIGAFTYTNHDCEMFETCVGRYCSIGQNTLLNPGVHQTDFLTTHPLGSTHDGVVAGMQNHPSFMAAAMTQMDRHTPARNGGRCEIGHDVWIGAGAMILNAARVGTGAVVGAGAVVTRDVPPFAIVVGSPARVTRFRFKPHLQARILHSQWWRYDLSRLSARNYSNVEGFLDLLEAEAPPMLSPEVVELIA